MTNEIEPEYRCPKCHESDTFQIEGATETYSATAWITGDGDIEETDASDGGTEWEDDCIMRCSSCDHHATVLDFRTDKGPAATHKKLNPTESKIAFAEKVLEILDECQNWDSSTIHNICLASEAFGLSGADDDGMFVRTPDAMPAKPSGQRDKPMHTPGPWRYSEPVVKFLSPLVWDERGWQVADCSGWHARPYEEKVANAHLIAAAPDLFEACLRCLDRDDIASDELGDLLRSAVSKAQGK